MKEYPILFNAEMVRAILEGRKTQTRRVIKPQPPSDSNRIGWHESRGIWRNTQSAPGERYKSPYGVPGDQLWVREAWRVRGKHTDIYSIPEICANRTHFQVWHQATLTWNDEDYGKLRPSIYMPRWASRINLLVKDIRVERVQDISEEDVDMEGVFNKSGLHLADCHYQIYHPDQRCDCGDKSVQEEFAILWDSINAKRGFGWDVNPWVWVVEFEIAR